MGCYDTVNTHCPVCGGILGLQTKAGKCNFEEFDIYSVPAALAEDLSEETEHNIEKCKGCETEYRLFANVARVAMTLLKIKE